ncbi:Rpn family recombination-promoting nuclease/putative transposase [Nocardia sp. NPDC048505]|uniref:Rpn family recombination-promoting nuclease/putative transposase n=1 Tax=Nocardia sp. NPDC048505 TaxID=3155756 RepID=UPI0033D8E3B6
MATPPTNPHDAYFRQVMSRPADAAGELRAILPKAVAARLDWNALELQPCSFVSQQLHSRYSDALFRTRLEDHEAYIYCLIEHQSRPDRMMAKRMSGYVDRIWDRYLGQHPDSETLPLVIPVVVHASPDGRHWNTPTQLSDLLDVDHDTRVALADYLPRFGFLLDDLTTVDITELSARKLTEPAFVLLSLLKIVPGNHHLDVDLLPLAEHLRELLGSDELEAPITYILTVGETSVPALAPLIDQLGPRAKEVLMTTGEQLRAEGEARGQARILLKQLALKFGTLPVSLESTIRIADTGHLELWAARLITAETLDEVFGS